MTRIIVMCGVYTTDTVAHITIRHTTLTIIAPHTQCCPCCTYLLSLSLVMTTRLTQPRPPACDHLMATHGRVVVVTVVCLYIQCTLVRRRGPASSPPSGHTQTLSFTFHVHCNAATLLQALLQNLKNE